MWKKLSRAVTLTREQKEQRPLAAAQALLESEKSQAQIVEDHGVTPSAVSKWRPTMEDGIHGLIGITVEKTRNLTRNVMTEAESNSLSYSKKVNRFMDGKQVNGHPNPLLR